MRSAAATTSISIARAIQCFVPGIPQVYYVGLLAGTNDMELLRRTGVGRDINRHYYTPAEMRAASCSDPVVRRCSSLLRLRNTHPAFSGDFHVPAVAGRAVWCWNGTRRGRTRAWTST